MQSREIVIPKSIFKKVLIGALISVLILFLLHLFSHYTVLIKDRFLYSLGDKTVLSSFYMECPLGKNHSFKGEGVAPIEVMDGKFSITKIFACVKAAFDHPIILTMLCIIITTILQLKIKIRLQDEKSEVGEESNNKKEIQKQSLTKKQKWVRGIIITIILIAITYPLWLVPFWEFLDWIFS